MNGPTIPATPSIYSMKSRQPFLIPSPSSRRMIRILACFAVVPLCAQAADTMLYYTAPATSWNEGLPVGNGRLGAMVFGGIDEERVQLNEVSLWSGPPLPEDAPGARDAIAEARRLIFAGQYGAAQSLIAAKALGERNNPRSHQTLGDLRIGFHGQSLLTMGREMEVDRQPDGTMPYRRELDLDTAVATTTYRRNRIDFRREVFVSPVADVIVVHLTASRPGQLSFHVTLDRPMDFETAAVGPATLAMRGQAQHDGEHLGVRYETRVLARSQGGTVRTRAGRIHVENADSATLLLAAATDYNLADPFRPLTRDLGRACAEALERAARQSVDELRTASIEEHRRLFRRMKLDLGDTAAARLPTDERLAALRQGSQDPGLEALLFQYGRYLLLCSSRPGNLPANLQGIWNNHLLAPWSADYHLNINAQMNYWPVEVANLSECHDPFFRLIEGLVPAARKTAANLGAGGMAAGLATDVWLFTAPYGQPGWGMWVMGFAWSTQHFMEHYRFSGDRGFLRDRAFPLLRGASEFFLDWLVPHPKTGLLVSGPSTSPENSFIAPDGTTAALSMGCAMDQQIIWETFTNTLEAARELEIRDAFTSRVEVALRRLAPTRIGNDGRIEEWGDNLKEKAPGHRHVSHLFALFPGRQINWRDTPELFQAARKSLEFRLANGGGHTGWSRAWIIAFWARLLDGDKAHENVRALLAHSTLANLFDNHPPFQIDGNFGYTAGVTEMLLQSHLGELHLLPALPAAWSNGSVTGLRTRGGVTVDLAWQDGRLASAVLRADREIVASLRYDGRVIRRNLPAGDPVTIEAASFATGKP